MLPIKSCGFMRYTLSPNIKCLSPLDQKLWPKLYNWPLTNDIDLMMLPLKMCSLVRFKYQMSISIGSNVMTNVTYIFDLWPSRMTLTLIYYSWKCTPYEIHILTKFQVSICIDSKVMANVKVVRTKLYIWPLTLKNDLDLILLPLKMCSLVRCTCTPNLKCLSLLDLMLWPR